MKRRTWSAVMLADVGVSMCHGQWGARALNSTLGAARAALQLVMQNVHDSGTRRGHFASRDKGTIKRCHRDPRHREAPSAARAPRALSRSSKPSAAQLAAQKLVQLSGIGLAAGRFHDLADEEAEELVLAGAVVRELCWILRHHLLDGADDRGAVGDLTQALGFDHGIRVHSLGPHDLEHLLGDLPRDGAIGDALKELREARRREPA